MADRYNVSLETPEYPYTLRSVDFTVDTSSDMKTVFWVQNKRGVLQSILLYVDRDDVSIRLLSDGVDLAPIASSIADLIASGCDVPHPVYPYAPASGVWCYTPLAGHRLSRFYQDLKVEVGAGAHVVGRVIWTDNEM